MFLAKIRLAEGAGCLGSFVLAQWVLGSRWLAGSSTC